MTTTPLRAPSWEHFGTDSRRHRLSFLARGHQGPPPPLGSLLDLVRCVQQSTSTRPGEAAQLVSLGAYERAFLGFCPGRHEFVLCAADGTGSGYYDTDDNEMACEDVEAVTVAVVPSEA